MKRKLFSRAAALALALCLLMTCAQALTADEARALLEKYYVDEIPAGVYEQDTVEGVLNALGDPYTEYYDAEAYQAFMDLMRDTVLVGIGVVSQGHEQGLLITDVLGDSPAEEAGLQPGDLIVAVDGKSAAGQSQETVSSWLRGEEGTQVLVTVLRSGVRRTYTMIRRTVVVPATDTTLLDGHIGYIECTTFGEETLGHFEDGVNTYDGAADHWLVDLRANSGGDVDASAQSAGAFAGGGYLAYLRDGTGSYYVSVREAAASTLDPVIVLTSGYTASASEIFASIIRDRNQGLCVGSRTYGKGVAQMMLTEDVEPDYFRDGDALKVTAYRFFSCNGAATDRVGIIPDLLISDENTPAAAYLLCGSGPVGDTAGLLRIDLRWRWYVDLETALSEEFRPAFTELLEAIPQGAAVWMGTGGADGWRPVTSAQAAEECGLADYAARGFTDVAESPYAYQIGTLGTYQLVDGYENGLFVPEDGLTRAELCELVVKAMRYPTHVEPSPFADVDRSAWYAPAVDAMYAAGLIDGVEPDLFCPEAQVDCQQLITILGRIAVQLSINFYGAEQEGPGEDGWGDAFSGFADWARPYAWLLAESQETIFGTVNLLWDDMANIDPSAPAARGEAAALLCNILEYAGIL